MKNTQFDLCTDYLVGKHTTVTFTKNITPSIRTHVLQLVYTGVYIADVQSLGSVRYSVSFIDAYSRTLEAFVISSKDKVFQCLRKLYAVVEHQTGLRFKVLRASNGEEYVGPFEKYCIFL